MIPGLSQLHYEERLCGTNLLSLEMCRLRADLIEVFNIVKGIDNADQCSFLNHIVKQALWTRTCLKSFHPDVDLIVEDFNFVTELFISGIVCRQKLSIRRQSMI